MNECSRFEDILTTCFWLCDLTATQSKTYLDGVSKSSGGGLYNERSKGGRRSLPHRGLETAEVASVLDKGFEDGAVHGNYKHSTGIHGPWRLAASLPRGFMRRRLQSNRAMRV